MLPLVAAIILDSHNIKAFLLNICNRESFVQLSRFACLHADYVEESCSLQEGKSATGLAAGVLKKDPPNTQKVKKNTL